MSTAKKMTIEEIESMSRGSVIWASYQERTEEGFVWNSIFPLMVCVPGRNGFVVGGDESSIVDRKINEKLLKDLTIWDKEPAKGQLPGITQEEYDEAASIDRNILLPNLIAEITSRGYTLKEFCKSIRMNEEKFNQRITGESEFSAGEMTKIVSALKLKTEMARGLFFPGYYADLESVQISD